MYSFERNSGCVSTQRFCSYWGSCSVATSLWSSLSWRGAVAERHRQGRSCSKHVTGSSSDPDCVCSSFGLAQHQTMTWPVKTRTCQKIKPSNSLYKLCTVVFLFLFCCVFFSWVTGVLRDVYLFIWIPISHEMNSNTVLDILPNGNTNVCIAYWKLMIDIVLCYTQITSSPLF